jgi:hypothetical protein
MNIGKEVREVEFEPVPESVPVEPPAPVPVPSVPAPVEEPVHAAVLR